MKLFTNWKKKYEELYEELRVAKALLNHANDKSEELQKQVRTLKREKRLVENQVDILKFQVVGLEKKLETAEILNEKTIKPVKVGKNETTKATPKKKLGRPKKEAK